MSPRQYPGTKTWLFIARVLVRKLAVLFCEARWISIFLGSSSSKVDWRPGKLKVFPSSRIESPFNCMCPAHLLATGEVRLSGDWPKRRVDAYEIGGEQSGNRLRPNAPNCQSALRAHGLSPGPSAKFYGDNRAWHIDCQCGRAFLAFLPRDGNFAVPPPGDNTGCVRCRGGYQKIRIFEHGSLASVGF